MIANMAAQALLWKLSTWKEGVWLYEFWLPFVASSDHCGAVLANIPATEQKAETSSAIYCPPSKGNTFLLQESDPRTTTIKI